MAVQSLLTRLKPEVKRVKVIDETGNECWRAPAEILETDTLPTNAKGQYYTMTREPGRTPKSPEMTPLNSVVEERLKLKKEIKGKDPIFKSLKKAPDSLKGLEAIILGMAEEAENIRFERALAEMRGKDTAALSLRRGQLLRSMAETVLKKRELAVAKEIDLASPTFKALLRLLFETFRDALVASGVPDDGVNDILTKLGKRMNSQDWESDAKRAMKNL